MKQLIKDFLSKYCTLVQDIETHEYIELMMDNHNCIEFEGVEYYVPKENSHWGEDETLLQEFIIQTYLI
jgi:hypothetical protein